MQPMSQPLQGLGHQRLSTELPFLFSDDAETSRSSQNVNDRLCGSHPPERIVVLIRPIFHLRFALRPSAQRSWIRPHFSFRSSLSYRRAPEARFLAPSPGRWSGSAQRLVQSPPSLCRMVVVVLSASPHQQSNRAEIGRISRHLGLWRGPVVPTPRSGRFVLSGRQVAGDPSGAARPAWHPSPNSPLRRQEGRYLRRNPKRVFLRPTVRTKGYA